MDRQNETEKNMMTNTNKYAVVLAALMAMGVSGSALAEGRGAGPMPTFEELDLDKDGLVTKEEMTAHRAAELKAADTNADGKLSAEELTAAHVAKMQARVAEMTANMITKLDTDKDGLVSAEEFAVAPGLEKMFDHVDENGDGSISKEEADEAGKGRGRGHGRHGKNGGGFFGGDN